MAVMLHWPMPAQHGGLQLYLCKCVTICHHTIPHAAASGVATATGVATVAGAPCCCV